MPTFGWLKSTRRIWMAPFVLGNLCSENSHIETMINGLFARDSAELAHESIGDHNAAFGHPVKLTQNAHPAI
jgi:hypothetical protein